MTQSVSTRDDGSPTQRKATLFCWGCDHSSPIDGDWVLQSREESVAYVCPTCETTLTERPRNEPSPVRATAGPLSVWRRALRTSATAWRASVDIGLSSLSALTGLGSTTDSRLRYEIG